jgi:rod shape-determining protein MreD
MAYLIGVPLLSLLAILQSTAISQIRLLDGRPDLMLLAIVAWGLTGRSLEAMILAAIGGIFLDLLSGLPFGFYAIALTIVAFLVSLMEGRFWEAHILMPLGVMLLTSLIYHLLGLLMLPLSGRGISLPFALLRVVLPSTFINLALILPTLQLASGLRDRIFPEEVEI